jgi:exopolysaccharide biosynthesis polyprenyl glycosylphosphotransferase
MAVLEQIADPLTTERVVQGPVLRGRQPVVSAWLLRGFGDHLALLSAVAVTGARPANVAFYVIAAIGLVSTGAYRRRISLSALDEAPQLAIPMAAALLLVGSASLFVTLPSNLFAQALLSTGGVLVARALTYSAIRGARRRGRLTDRALVVGAGAIGIELHKQLADHPEYGMQSVGIVDDVRPEDGLPLLGTVDQLEEVVLAYDVRRLIIAFGPTGEQDMIATLRAAAFLDLDVHVVPRFFELGLAPVGPDVEQIWGIPLYRVRRAALRETVWKMKRVIDVAFAATALLVLAPALAAIALLVRLSSRGPVLFRQVRVGQHGRPIEVLKFRTLRVNLDSDITWSVQDDPRQTRVGKWLRRLSLDELPQLWNVVRGDMSLVGPRPERPLFVNRFSTQVTRYSDRHRLPVGLTGLAQVHGLRGDTSIEERARFDNFYIEHWSPWTDIKILIRTVTAVMRDALTIGRRKGDEGERAEQAHVLSRFGDGTDS